MPDDINHLDTNDDGLKAIFGDRFHDESNPTVVISKKETTTTPPTGKAAQKPMQKPVQEQWQPPKPEPNWYDKLKACAIWAVGFGSLTFLFFSWQQAGLMDSSVAVPTMLTCTALAGWGVGKNATGGR